MIALHTSDRLVILELGPLSVTLAWIAKSRSRKGFRLLLDSYNCRSCEVGMGRLIIVCLLRLDIIRWRVQRWRRRIQRARLWLDPRPVYVAYHGFCCDTGPFSWCHDYPNGRSAFRATTADALFGASDGPTTYEIISREEWDSWNWRIP